ncbi:sugar phosphate isomerase/epimerase family protein [Desulfococcaceae bacterium HSG9]|nr:sugar phosphate isomerase/epimerase family protein [Desulfococcaceae bacterium HSG9]
MKPQTSNFKLTTPKIGMPSSAMVLAPWTKAIQAAAANDFDAFEVVIVYPSADLDSITPHEITKAKAISEKKGMEICVHAPFFELNIAGYCQGIRNTSVRYIKKATDLCAALGGNILIVHAGNYIYNFPPGTTPDNYPLMKIQWDNNIESLRKINDYANDKGLIVCLENIGDRAIDKTFEHLLEIRQSVGDSLKFTLDIGHARLWAEGGVERGLKVLGDNIRHIHFTDNNGIEDDHLPIGDGNSDYSGFMRFIRAFPHIVTLEVLDIGYDPATIIRSREYFTKLCEINS